MHLGDGMSLDDLRKKKATADQLRADLILLAVVVGVLIICLVAPYFGYGN